MSVPLPQRPQIKVGDYVSVHSIVMGSSHLPCRVVGEFDGRYQLYCLKGVLDTTFSRAEVIPMTRCTPIPMEEWRQAPKVSLRRAASDSAMIEHCNCQIPVCSEDTDIISVSEEEHEAPVMWVNNGAYCLSHSDQQIVLSRRGWLTDKIIHAAQILLLQFFYRHGRTATSCTAEGVCIPGPFWGVCTDHTCQKQPLVCCVQCWLWNWGRPCVRQLV